MITHIKFVSIPTRDQDRALAFWTERVGCRLLTDQPFDDKQRWIELRIGTSETRLVLFSGDGPGAMQPGGSFNGALACDNVERRRVDYFLAVEAPPPGKGGKPAWKWSSKGC